MILANCLSTLLVGPMPVIVRMKNYFSKFITSFIMTLKEMILMIMRIVLMLMMMSLSMSCLSMAARSVEVDDHFVFILY